MNQLLRNYDVYLPCPCGSGKKGKFCCWISSGKWHKKKSHFLLPARPAENAVDRCYLKSTLDCGGNISREHYISEGVLKQLNENNVLQADGLLWIDGTANLPTSAFTSKILCEKHNSLLSMFDDTAIKFFKLLTEFENAFKDPHAVPKSEVYLFAGEDIERWM